MHLAVCPKNSACPQGVTDDNGQSIAGFNDWRSYCRGMGRVIVVIVGVVIALFGLLFALQGFGVVGGSPMSNTTTWSILGPIIALIGIAIAVGAARRRKP